MAPTPNSLFKILVQTPLLATRLWLCLGALMWSILLMWPGELFIPSRTTYVLMAKVAPEHVWALAFFTQSVWAFYTLRTGTRNNVTLAMDALLGCVLWTSSTLLCFIAHWPSGYTTFFEQLDHYPPPAAMSGEVVLVIASWWHLVRHWAEEETLQDTMLDCDMRCKDENFQVKL